MAELHPRPFIPFMVAAAGIGTFSLMDVAMKDLALSIGTYNAVMWRNCLGALFMGLLGAVQPVIRVLAIAEFYSEHLPMAIATGSPKWVAEWILQSLGIRDWFGAVVG